MRYVVGGERRKEFCVFEKIVRDSAKILATRLIAKIVLRVVECVMQSKIGEPARIIQSSAHLLHSIIIAHILCTSMVFFFTDILLYT